ncbi:MAG: LysR substrate-binding domain-containing protein [Marinomonas colpomeniae]
MDTDDQQNEKHFEKMDLRKLPPLKALKGFEAAARLSSVRGAAEELNLTHPAISHQIQTLEASLASKLFTREGRHIQLTEAGKQYYQFVRKALDILITGSEEIRDNTSQPALRIQTYITTSIRWLAPRLPKFKKQNPDIRLQVSTYNADWNFDEKHADIGIICKTQPLPDHLSWQSLFQSQVFPVCSPEFFTTLPQDIQPKDLPRYPLISVYTEDKYWTWIDWFESADVQVSQQELNPKILEVDTLAAALEMAVVGEGIALVNGPFADNDLATGRLVVPIHHYTKGLGEWGIVCHKNLTKDKRAKAFIDWLVAQAS